MPSYSSTTLLLSLLGLLSNLPAQAGGLAQLQAFIDSTRGLQARFDQTVTQQSGRKQQTASGTVAILRPGKFDWRYQKPYEQRVVGDGEKLWVYDPDLNQVTVKNLDAALGSSPAALLAGNNNLEKHYRLSELPARDGLEWISASPKSRENTFETVQMGFVNDTLMQMELKDNFGQQTVIRFTQTVKNPPLAVDLFRFIPPKGADVVSAMQ